MSRFKRALLGFMVIANLGIYTAFGLWLLVDGGLTGWLALGPAAAQVAPSPLPSPSPTLLPTVTVALVAAPPLLPTPGWTPPAVALVTPTPLAPSAEPTAPAGPAAHAAAPAGAPPQSALPASARIEGVVGRRQSLPLSCESRSAADLAAYFGVIIDELEFLAALPHSDDPDRGFVGDVNGEWGSVPPEAYGVHAAPVARLLRDFGLPAESHRYMKWDRLRAEIAAGRPVIVWVTGHVEEGEGLVYTAGDGRRTIVARYEHTVIVIGYDEDSVLVVDGANTYRRPIDLFLESWGALRNLAVTLEP